MGDRQQYQPLTTADRVSVLVYRFGIGATATLAGVMALFIVIKPPEAFSRGLMDAALIALYIFTGISVFFIHLYVSKFKRALIKIYIASLVALGLLFYLGGGSPSAAVAIRPVGTMLLLPLSLCIGFITAKEAFCFQLMEGYILAISMPLYLTFISIPAVTSGNISTGFVMVAAFYVYFTLRKIFMPLHYDIGDKSAYQ